MERILEEMIRDKYIEENPYSRPPDDEGYHARMILQRLVDDYWETKRDTYKEEK